MNKSRSTLLDSIFAEALGLTGRDRARFVRERCRHDPYLEERVLSLLQTSEASDEVFARQFSAVRDRLWQSVIAEKEPPEEDLAGKRFNAWRLEKRIARGGLASVYLARREDGAFEQTVAFKVLRRGLDTDDLVTRFRAEREILSALDHPSIAQIYDGGALDDGRPYLVLEYVDGLPITTHCEQYGVDVRGRVALLIEVLLALHHAHQHLVVHRDVKPSNILVSPAGHVVLLDFGIAKLLDPRSFPGASALTRTGVSLLTPGYGSPEQRAGEAITTASDIYQVGLVMYELLSGQRPFAKRGAAVDQHLVPPSHHLRGTSRYNDVRGDLDAMTRQAMHLDPAQRYASADEMCADLRRYLDGLPVTARPDTLRYRMTKLTKRKPWLVPVVTATVLAIVVYVGTLTAYSNRLAREERLSAASQKFMVEVFRSPDPYASADGGRRRDITVIEAIGIGEQRVREELDGQPQLQASLLASMSDVYGSLDRDRDAIRLREEALVLERQVHGDRSSQVVASLRVLGSKYMAVGEPERADAMLREQLAMAREIYPADATELAESEIAMALYLQFRGDLADFRSLLQQAIERLRSAPQKAPQALIDALIMSAVQSGMEDADQAFAAIAEAKRVADSAFGPESLQAALVRVRLASSMSRFGDYESSEEQFRQAIPVLESRLGKDHSSTLSTLNNLGFLYSQWNNQPMAEKIHAEVLERQIAKRGPVHRVVADSYQNLAGAITRLGRYDESILLHRHAYDIYKEVLNDDNFRIAFPLLSIAYVELQRHNAQAAEEAAREALERLSTTVGGSYLEGVARCLVGVSLEQQDRTKEGSALVRSSHELLRAVSVPDPYPALCRVPSA